MSPILLPLNADAGRPMPARSLPLRLLVAALTVGIPFVLANIAVKLLLPNDTPRDLANLLKVAIVLLAYRLHVRRFEKRAVTELGLAGAGIELGVGIAIGLFLFTAIIALLAGLGVFQVAGVNHWSAALAWLPKMIAVALFEEVVFRGLLFRLLEQSLGSWIALGLSSTLFGLAHLANPGATVLTGIMIGAEAGILFGTAFMVTRRLWLCMGIHFAWNFAQGAIFSISVSGLAANGWLKSRMLGPNWLSGGDFGVEGSVPGFIVCVAAGLALLFLARRAGRLLPSARQRSAAQDAQ